MMIDKKLFLFDRDDEGKLIPKELHVKEINDTILMTPLTRGEIKKIFVNLQGEDDSDGKIILEHCHNPKFTVEEVKYLKPNFVKAVVNAILRESGVITDDDGVKKKSMS